MKRLILLATVITTFGLPLTVFGQGTAADYERANGLKAKYEAAAIDISGAATWIGNTHRFWYRKLSRGVYEYIIFDADTLQKKSAFDHSRIAATLTKLLGANVKANHRLADAFVADGHNDAQAHELSFSIAQGMRDVPALLSLLEDAAASNEEIMEAVYMVLSNRHSLMDAAALLSLETRPGANGLS